MLLSQQADRFAMELSAFQRVQLKQLDVNEKAFAQLRAADPWQYQSIQAMAAPGQYDVPYDPSEEAEAQRIAERTNTKDDLNDSLTAEERAIAADIGLGFL